jgi:hypothetical protein
MVEYVCPECFKKRDRVPEGRKAGALRQALKWSVPR